MSIIAPPPRFQFTPQRQRFQYCGSRLSPPTHIAAVGCPPPHIDFPDPASCSSTGLLLPGIPLSGRGAALLPVCWRDTGGSRGWGGQRRCGLPLRQHGAHLEQVRGNGVGGVVDIPAPLSPLLIARLHLIMGATPFKQGRERGPPSVRGLVSVLLASLYGVGGGDSGGRNGGIGQRPEWGRPRPQGCQRWFVCGGERGGCHFEQPPASAQRGAGGTPRRRRGGARVRKVRECGGRRGGGVWGAPLLVWNHS